MDSSTTNSYQQYLNACRSFQVSPTTVEEYESLITESIPQLTNQQEGTYVDYEFHGLIVRILKNKDTVSVTYCSQESYNETLAIINERKKQ